MKPLLPAKLPPISVDEMMDKLRTMVEHVPEYRDEAKLREAAIQQIERLQSDRVFMNDDYQVNVTDFEWNGLPAHHLSIKRRDRGPVHDWRDLQAIKNQLVGEECEAVELYPAESRLVDSANQFHLWAVADPSFRFPFGFSDRLVCDTSAAGAVQRARAESEAQTTQE